MNELSANVEAEGKEMQMITEKRVRGGMKMVVNEIPGKEKHTKKEWWFYLE